jgi:hypothetical protein
MRRILALSIFLLPVLHGVAQNVTGTWAGYFSYDKGCASFPQLIYLQLKQAADSTITGYSNTCVSLGRDRYDTLVCEVRGWVKAGRVEIIETGGIGLKSETADMSLQKMKLKYRSVKNNITLRGWWTGVTPSFCNTGEISFKKLDE